jgi:hypothetical protein
VPCTLLPMLAEMGPILFPVEERNKRRQTAACVVPMSVG